ncbi:hypothetical protein F2Q69_00012707 [Brassica cretica]|uniref:Uncharacterized protein n=1 Tax=Brassica cretica TaxID=69181 RepID=A0A8S9QXE6_BRACR|nr:hypothetical protein F2Q69_00012707 [Brassica cretica]
MRSSSTSVIGLPSKTTSWLSEEDIKKLSHVIMDVEKQFRDTHTTRPSLEEHNQELITSVSELNSAEQVSTTSIQGDQAKESSVAIQKDEQPVQNVMVPFKQAIVPEETPREPQTACKKGQLIVFDPCDLQKTFLDTFLIHLFVWNKTRAVELSRHELGMEHVVFEPGGDLWNHRNNPIVIEKKSAATTIVFGDLLPSEVKGMHVSAQQELQIYLWKPGAYDSILIIPGECSARARTSLGNKELEADQNVLLLDHVKVWKPLDLQKLQYHFRDCQTKSGDGDFIRVNGQTVLSAIHFERRGYSNDQSIKNGSLAKLEMQQSNLGSCLAASFDIGAVRGSYLSNQKEKQQTQLPWKLNSSWSHVELESCPKFRTSQSYLWRPGEHAKTRAVEFSRHELGMENVVFEPGGELWNHRNNPKMIEKKSAATTIVFGDLLPSEVKVFHVSSQQEFHYETNWRMLPTFSWIQQIRQRSKWPPDHQVIVNFAKHIGLAKFCELLISDWAGRLQIYLWKPGAYDSILIIFGECSARARTRLGNKELEADQNALLLDHVKVWKPPDLQKLQYHFRD